MNYPLTKDFKRIVIENLPLIDVRAEVEFEKGAFLNSVNLPILNNEERHIIGVCYKEKGNAEATKLGYELVSGKIREERLNSWINFIKENPNSVIYCFRGGSRSKISQEWIINDLNKDIPRIEGGYKAFRNYLIDEMALEKQSYSPIILTGYTGSSKTTLLNKISNGLDLEGIANHRGSSFGSHIKPQPSQIDFENNLAYRLIQLKEKNFNNIIIEDEGKNIGRNFIPKSLQDHFSSGKYVVLDSSLEERISNTLKEYVIESQKEYKDFYGEDGLEKWFNYIQESMNRVRKRFGGDKLNQVIKDLEKAYNHQLSTGSFDLHRDWIERFLREYYDPLYKKSIKNSPDSLLFKGNYNEVLDFFNSLK